MKYPNSGLGAFLDISACKSGSDITINETANLERRETKVFHLKWKIFGHLMESALGSRLIMHYTHLYEPSVFMHFPPWPQL